MLRSLNVQSRAQDLLRQGIAAARAGQTDLARQLFARTLQLDPQNEQAWLWLSGVAQSDEERIQILEQLLKINPNNEHAIKGLQALGALPDAEPDIAVPAATEEYTEEYHQEEPVAEEAEYVEDAPVAEFEQAEYLEDAPVDDMQVQESVFEEAASPDVSPLANAPPPPAPDGIPLIEPDILAYVQQLADTAVRVGMAEQRDVDFGVNWIQTEKRRSIRRAINPLLIAGVVGGIIAVGAAGFGIFTILNADGSGRPQELADVLPSPSPTITLTPTGTATPIPEASSTATLASNQATFTPEATFPPGIQRGNLDFGITETPPYFATVHPDNPSLDRAIAKFHEGDYAAVIEEIPAARDSGPDLPDSYFFEGMSYAFLGQYDRAEEAITDGIQRDGQIAALHAALGYVYLKQGAIEESRLSNAEAKRLDPVLILTYLTLAEDFTEAELYDSALAEVAVALELDPGNVEVLVAQGNVLLAQGRPEDAAAVGELAYYIDPSAEKAVLMLAQSRIALGQYDRAVQPLEQYLGRVNQSSVGVWATLGEARFFEGNLTNAFDAYSRALALALGTDNAAVLARRGQLFLGSGDYEAAFADFDESLALEENSVARLGRAEAALALGQPETVLEDVEQVLAGLEEDADDYALRLLRGKALVGTQRYNEAIVELDQLVILGTADISALGDAYDYRGRAKYFLTNYSSALVDIEQALQIEETGSRHYFRGLALEGLFNVAGAKLEYEWVLFWNSVYGYDFGNDVAARLENLNEGGQPQGAAGVIAVPTPIATPSP